MINPEQNNNPLYNSRIIDNYLKLVKKRYPEVDLRELLFYADMKTYQVADQAHWFTQKQIDRFYEKLVIICDYSYDVFHSVSYMFLIIDLFVSTSSKN